MFGNDFLPGIESVKLQKNGMIELMNAYKKIHTPSPSPEDKLPVHTPSPLHTPSPPDNFIIETTPTGKKINWILFNKLIKELTKTEKENIMKEKRSFVSKSESKEKINVVYKREYIKGEEWKIRYNKQFSLDENDVKEYKKGLEWILKYYTTGEHEMWYYKKAKGVLLSDLLKDSLFPSTPSISSNREQIEIKQSVQLAYVLPLQNHELLCGEQKEYLKKNHKELYPTKYSLEWEFTKYLWETTPILPEITVEQILKWNADDIHFPKD
jgi:5'-3' exonuclease